MADDPSRNDDPTKEPPREPDGGLQDILRRAISTGMKGFLKSEENIRAIASDIWHSDKVGAVGAQLRDLREDITRVVGGEIVKYLEKINLADEIVKILTAISLEVKTEIRFIPNEKKLVKPDLKADVRFKRARKP